ncbi:helix-turn-helix domain-containing protein [Bradyrhizobium sp. USDA 10063]
MVGFITSCIFVITIIALVVRIVLVISRRQRCDQSLRNECCDQRCGIFPNQFLLSIAKQKHRQKFARISGSTAAPSWQTIELRRATLANYRIATVSIAAWMCSGVMALRSANASCDLRGLCLLIYPDTGVAKKTRKDAVPITAIRRLRVSDFEVLRNAVQDTSVDIMQIESGRMDGSVLHLEFDEKLGVSTGDFTRGIRSRGSLSDHRLGIGMVLHGPAVMNQVEMLPGELLVLQPGTELHTHFSAANGYMTVFMTQEELRAYPGAAEAVMLQRPDAVLSADPVIAAERIRTFQWLLAELSAKEAGTMSDGATEFFRRALLDLFIQPLLERVDYRKPRLRQSTARLVREVEQYLTDIKDRPVHNAELAEKFGMSLRSLQRAFYDETGLGLIAFQRRKRLHQVHTRLRIGVSDLALNEAETELFIKDIAREHGFIHYPLFTSQYQELFGEKPSHTMRRGRRGIFRDPHTNELLARSLQFIERSNALLKDNASPDTFLGNGVRKKKDDV